MKRKIYLSMLLLAFFALLASVLAFFFVMYADARTQAFRQLEAESAILCSEANVRWSINMCVQRWHFSAVRIMSLNCRSATGFRVQRILPMAEYLHWRALGV